MFSRVISKLARRIQTLDGLSTARRVTLLRLAGVCISDDAHVRSGLRLIGDGRLFTLGRCRVNVDCLFDASGATIAIGDNVSVGHGVRLICTTHELGGPDRRASVRRRNARIIIEDGAWIGAGATILPGVVVGAGAVVAAGSVVNRDVAPNLVVGGVPGKVLRCL